MSVNIILIIELNTPSTVDPQPMDTATFELSAMRAAAGNACNLMKVLANPDRLLILCQLSQGEMRVGDLEE